MTESEKEHSRWHVVQEFCADTTTHGLGRVAAANSLTVRTFWITIFLSAFIFSIYQISVSFPCYLENPTKTHVTMVKTEGLHFPGVTVCNINPMKHSKLVNSTFWESIVSYGISFLTLYVVWTFLGWWRYNFL